MNVTTFTRAREGSWAELEEIVARAGNRPERLGAGGVLRLGELYRAAAADLAYARRRFGTDPVVARLENLVVRARSAVYAASGSERGLRGLFTDGYWRRMGERWPALALASALLLVPALLGGLWGAGDASAAIGIVPDAFRGAVTPGTSGGLTAGDATAFSSEVFTNNVVVTFVAFAGGILAGLGTAVVLAINGLILGVVVGIALAAGNDEEITSFVFAHGLLELSCIVAAAAAGLSMGWALIRPGGDTRAAAVAREAREGVLIVIGTIPWLLLAGLVEGLVSRRAVDPPAALAIGASLAALYWGLVAWRGRAPARASAAAAPPRSASDQSVARSFERT